MLSMNEQQERAIERWLETNGTDHRLEYCVAKSPEWLQAIPNEVLPVVEAMMLRFEYYGQKRVNTALKMLFEKLREDYKLDTQKALYTYIPDSRGRINSSNDYWFEFRSINNIPSQLCTDNISRFAYWEYVKNVVIVDDFCGSGDTIKTYIMDSEVDFAGKTVYYVVVHEMEEAEEVIKQLETHYKLKIVMVSLNTSPKFFKEGQEDSKLLFRDGMRKLDIKKDQLGYSNTEALVAFHNNTPNNTFPVFWKDTEKNVALFPRKIKIESPWSPKNFQGKKDKRRKQNYLAMKSVNVSG